jgi:hypothetical protein
MIIENWDHEDDEIMKLMSWDDYWKKERNEIGIVGNWNWDNRLEKKNRRRVER